MKTILLLLFTTIATAQNDFKIENGQLIWQKVIYEKASQQDIESSMRSSGMFDNISSGSSIIADIKETPINYRDAGFNTGNCPMYISASNMTGTVNIDLKDDRYRITVRNILLEGNVPNLAIAQHKGTLDYYATKKGEFRKAFETKHYIIFQKQFESMFTFNNDNDW